MKRLYILPVLLAVSVLGQAKPRTPQQLLTAAAEALRPLTASQHRAPNRDEREALECLHEGQALSIMGYADGGYAVVTHDDLLPAVVGYSAAVLDTDNPNFAWWLRSMEASAREFVAEGTSVRLTAPQAGIPRDVPQMLTSAWGQTAPFNDLCPRLSDGRALVGCVATAATQIMYYHGYPTQGTGRYTDVQTTDANGQIVPVTVDFADYTFRYSQIRDTYVAGCYSADEARAVAELSFAVGASFGMIYGVGASGTFSDSAVVSLRNHLGFPDARVLNRYEYETGPWMQTIYNELAAGRPLMYSGADDIYTLGGGGHAFVFDGYNAEGLVHVNWGWFGSNDGYYDVSLLNPRQHNFKNQQDMIIGIAPPGKTEPQTLTVSPAILIDGHLPATACYGSQAQRIILPEGVTSIDDGAFAACPKLREVVFPAPDESQQFVVCDNVIYTRDQREVIEVLPYYYNNVEVQPGYNSLLTLPEGVERIHDCAFGGCFRLKGIMLPTTVSEVGTEAFRGATNLKRITLRSPLPPEAAWDMLAGVDVGYTRLAVPAGSIERYRRAAGWRQFFTLDNVVEWGTCIRARNLIRQVGEANPELTYEMLGQWVEGEPQLSCDADESSPAGTYPIWVTLGTLAGQDITLEDGTLTIVEPSAIEQVAPDAAPRRVAYDLQGRRLKPGQAQGFVVNNHSINFIK